MKGAPFVRTEGDVVITDWYRIEIVIPEAYFSEPPLVEDMGQVLDALCFFDVRAYIKEDSKPELFAVRLPARLRIIYTEAMTETDAEGEKYNVYTSYKDDILIENIQMIQSTSNVSALFRVMAGARVSAASYTDLAEMFIEGAKLNNANPGATRMLLEAVIAEMCRWSKSPDIPFRNALFAGKADMHDFQFYRLKDLPRLNSVFTGIGFEDIQLAVQSGVKQTVTGAKQHISPMEEIIKY